MSAVPSSDTPAYRPLLRLYVHIGAAYAMADEMAVPVPMGPAAALRLPPIVKLPARPNDRTASSLFMTTTNSVMSAPAWKPNPTPPVIIQLGADHEPSGKRAVTTPLPALPLHTKPALTTVKMARPRAFCSTALGIELSADSGLCGSARNPWRILAARSHSLGRLGQICIGAGTYLKPAWILRAWAPICVPARCA